MTPPDLISVARLCESHQVDVEFIDTLREYGLIEAVAEDGVLYIHIEHIPRVEKIFRLHFELDINLAGIEAITHLLERSEQMRIEITALKNRLRRFEQL